MYQRFAERGIHCGTYEQIKERIREGASPDIIGASAALAISLVRKRAELWLVSDGISDQEAQQISIRRFSDVQEAIDSALLHIAFNPVQPPETPALNVV